MCPIRQRADLSVSWGRLIHDGAMFLDDAFNFQTFAHRPIKSRHC